jgi:hypothetical protein
MEGSDAVEVGRRVTESLQFEKEKAQELKALLDTHQVDIYHIGRVLRDNLNAQQQDYANFYDQKAVAEQEYREAMQAIVQEFQLQSDQIKIRVQKFFYDISNGEVKLTVGKIISKIIS